MFLFTACGDNENNNNGGNNGENTQTYTITFKNYDGSIISQKTDYHYGDSVVVPSETPSRPSDNVYTYTFVG